MKNDKKDFDKLNPTDRARVVSVAKLTSHFRGLEDSGLLNKEETSKFIGAVRILESQANGTFVAKVAEVISETPVLTKK